MGTSAFRDGSAIPVGPAAVSLLAWRHGGVLRVTVIAKATFAFAHDAEMPRIAAQPVLEAEVHQGNMPTRSIRFSSDRVPYLNRTDVVFTGQAYAYAAGKARTTPVRLGLFDGDHVLLDKTLYVRHEDGAASVPLVYERAYGGPGWAENPYGVGAVAGSGEPAVTSPIDPKQLAGFAPIGAAWTSRRKLVAGLPRGALAREPMEIPDDFAWAYFQAAPPDQWAPFLRGDEWIVMDGLHPVLPRARMRLPGASGMARVYGLSGSGVVEGQPLPLHADVLRIDGDELRCTLTFRGVFPVADEAALASLRVAAGVELPGEPLSWPDVSIDEEPILLSDEDLEPGSIARPGLLDRAPAAPFEGTLSLGGAGMAPVALPFRKGPAAGASAAGAVPRGSPRAPSLETVAIHDEAAHDLSLPFRPPTSAELRAQASAPRVAPQIRPAAPFGATAAFASDDRPPAVLPFAPTAQAQPALVSTPHEILPEPPPPAAPPPVEVEAPAPPPPAMTAAPEPPPPAPPPPPPPAIAGEKPKGSPWAAQPEAPPPPPRAPKPATAPMQSPPAAALQKGLYGRFGGR